MPSRTALRRVHRRRDKAVLSLRVADSAQQRFRVEFMDRMLEVQYQQAKQRLADLNAEAAAERREARPPFRARIQRLFAAA